MTHEKEVDNMPIWQDHERRITTLENTFSHYGTKLESVEKQVTSIGSKIDVNGEQQKELLDKLIGHHLETGKMKLSGRIKIASIFVGSILGSGSAVAYVLLQIF